LLAGCIGFVVGRPSAGVSQEELPPSIAAQLARGEVVGLASLAAEGARLPHFAYPTLDGRTFDSNDLAGRPAVLIFWSPTCSGATQVVRQLGTLRDGLAPQNVRLVLVNVDSVRAAARRALGSEAERTEVLLTEGAPAIFTDPARYVGKPAGLRPALLVPGFLVLDATGVVRASGMQWNGPDPVLRAVAQLPR
jgi:peroxiredoxin